jgi:gliding motility-associated-like protein
MKKIIFSLLLTTVSICGYSQMAQEGFESTTGPDALPATTWSLGTGDWAVFDNGVGTGQRWGINSAITTPPVVYQGVNSAYVRNENIGAGNTSEDYLATPLVTIPANGQLRFFTRMFTSGNQGTIYQIKIAPGMDPSFQTDPSAYTLVQQWTETELTTTFNIYEEKTVDLTAYAGMDVYVSFVMVYTQPDANLGGDRWLVDNVSIVQQCFPPTAAVAGLITQTSATLSWTGTASQYEIEIVPAASAPTGVGTVITTNSYLATATTAGVAFTPTTAYKYYVRAICSGGVTSTWVGPIAFSTSSPGLSCSSPIVISTLPYSTTDNTSNYSDNPAIEGTPGASGCGSTNTYLNGNDVVYSFTASFTGVVNVTMTPTATFSGIFVYNSCSNIGVSCLAGVANAGTTPRVFDLPVTSGTTYYIVISTWATPQTTAYTLALQRVNCPPPTTLSASNIGQTTAQLSWANPGSATSWQVAVQAAGAGLPTGSGITTSINTNYPVSGLTAATAYQYYVRSDCGDGTFSVWAGPFAFNTTVCDVAQQCNYTFTMNDTFGDGWNGGVMQIRQNGIVVATLTGPTAAQGTTPVSVTVPMCDGLPYDLFWSVGGTFPAEMGVKIINSFGQTLYIKAPGTGTAGSVLYTNTVNCLVPECLPPTALTATAISETGATLGWTSSGAETQWQILILPAGSAAPTSTSTGWTLATSNPFTVSGLTAGTAYDYYVRPVCSVTNIGGWSAAKTFTTSICPIANQCNYTFIMTDSFGDGWNGGVMQVRQNGIVVATLTGPTDADNLNPISVTVPLCHGIPFDLYWSTAGTFPNEMGISIKESLAPQEVIYTKPAGTGSALSVLYAGTAECIPPTCPKPNSLVISGISQTAATVSWTEAGTATSWEIYIVTAGSAAPTSTSTGIVVTSIPYTFNTLLPASTYDVYIRALCSPSDISYWSNKTSFSTLIQNDECSTATVTPVNPTIACDQTASGSLVGATASPQSNTCGGTDDDDVWFQFTATSNQHAISLLNVAGSTTDLFHVLYSGTCGALTQMYCSDANSSVATGLIVGQTYYIRVYSWTATAGQTSTFDVCVATIPPPISTNNTLYTTSQLVTEVLLNSTCASVTNVTSSTGTNFGSTNGIGYFNKNGSTFPFNDGIVLTSGNALSAAGPNSTTLSDGVDAWPGDANLNAIVLAATGNAMNSHNATKLEFNFVPLSNEINFNFIFASEEYGTFQCDYSDAFAFLLTDIASGVTTNLAVIPSTTTPVSVVTIRNQLYNTNCASVNPQYFDSFYGLGGLDPLGSPTNFNGITVPLTATSPVIPGHQYHIKLVIADRLDNALDSAVFLEGGSLDIGNVDLGTDFLQATNNALCYGESYTIHSGLNPAQYTFTWSNGTSVLPGETGPDLTVTQSGVYSIAAQYINTTCAATDTITIEYYDPILPGTPTNLLACDSTGFSTFDLSANTPVVLATMDPTQYTVTYYASNADAIGEVNALPLQYTNVVPTTQVIYVRIENNTSGCYEIRSFTLTVNPLITPTFTIDTAICQTGTASILPTTSLNGISGIWSPAVINNLQSGDYVFTPTPGSCGTTVSISVVVTPQTTPTFLAPAPICNGGSVPVLPTTSLNGITGSWSPNTVDNTQTATYTFTPDANQCATTTTMTITVLQNCQFGSYASAVWLTDCDTNNFFNTMGTGADIIGPISNIFPNTDLGTYVSNSHTFILRGAEVKTFKTPTANVCSARLNYRIYPQSGTPGAFTVLNLPFFDNCGSGSFASGGPCNPGDQKWQKVLNNSESPIDLTAYAPGEYVIEVYYDVTGDVNSTTQCDDTVLINNNGANYIANYTLQANPTYTHTNPTSCNATDGTITITSLAPITSYNMTYTDGSTVVGPTTITSDAAGTYTITGLNAGSYSNFTYLVNGCTINSTDTVQLVDQPIIPTFDPITICHGVSPAPSLPTSSLNGILGAWSPATVNTNQTATYTFYANSGQCAVNGSLTVTVTPQTPATFNPINPICYGATAPALPITSIEGYTGTWSADIIDTTQSLNYVFTPDAGQCASAGTISVVITPKVTPTFALGLTVASCSNTTQTPLPLTSIEGITGTWSPSVLDYSVVGTTVYTFTPTAGLCANTTTLTAVITATTTPTFSVVPGICTGDTLTALPTNSLNGYTGTWSPALNNTATTLYTFTPAANQCATTATLQIVVTPKNPATFASMGNLCIGETAPALPTISLEGYTGTWSPATINNTTTTTYTFTPTAGQCASNGTLIVPVFADFDFSLSGNCIGSQFTLQVDVLSNSFDSTTANYAWHTSSNQSVGTNSSTFNVTEYLASTPATETLPMDFSVTVTTTDGCTKTHPITLTRVFCDIQKGISVNNDGKNEFFDLTGYNVKHLSIFNRYGMKVYTKSNYTNQWVGQSDKGEELPDGTYYYVIDFNDNQSAKTGWIYINRAQ